jgi:hypothetical protein
MKTFLPDASRMEGVSIIGFFSGGDCCALDCTPPVVATINTALKIVSRCIIPTPAFLDLTLSGWALYRNTVQPAPLGLSAISHLRLQ